MNTSFRRASPRLDAFKGRPHPAPTKRNRQSQLVEHAEKLSRALLSVRGEASGEALARDLIATYRMMTQAEKAGFFEILTQSFSPRPEEVADAADRYACHPGPDSFVKLWDAVEPPRQELFRRVNFAQGGTEALIAMRADLIALLDERPHLRVVDFDFKHLFSSWFNRGFLRLENINWHTPAVILEKLIKYEAVHEINGWSDLRRRLEADRRCFAFFHPSLPDEPLIFVEVALTRGVARKLEPLLNPDAPILDPASADTAVFYSISNCLVGLRGISFGSFLIKRVMKELKLELKHLRNFVTLSPLPGFARALSDRTNPNGFTRERIVRLLDDYAVRIIKRTGARDSLDALTRMLSDPLAYRELLSKPLARLALAYLTKVKHGDQVSDPVAHFHLANGAQLDRINTFANLRPYGMESSFGVMVNYRYVPSRVEHNHEAFVREGTIVVASRLRREYDKINALWDQDKSSNLEVRS